MSYLTICQNVAKTAGLTIPTTISGVNSADNIRLSDAVNTAGIELSRPLTALGGTYEWSVLHEWGSIDTEVGVNNYALPEDCQYIVNMTIWSEQERRPLQAISPVVWQALTYGVTPTTAFIRRIRVKGNYIWILPTPTDIITIQFEYMSKNWCQSAAGVPQQKFLLDSDVGILDEYLIELGAKWRLLRDLGRDFGAYEAEYRSALNAGMGNDNLCDPVYGSRRNFINPWSRWGYTIIP